MRSHHDEIGGGRLGDRKNLGVNARARGYKYLGMQVIGFDLANPARKFVFQVCDDRVVAD